jgi:chromosome segregation ATPase
MSKQPTERGADADSRRAVTETDLQTIDKAISAHEGLGLFLYTTRRILGEIGKLETHYRGIKEAIAVVGREGEQTNAQLEQARSQLATVQAQEVEKRKVVAELDREVAEKQRMLEHYSKAIERITGAAA